jgi:CHASE2 domain-containing sensor protein
VLVGVLSVVPVIPELQVRLIDTVFQRVPVPKQRFRVVVVLIDDDSLQKYGRWPWSRELLARLIDNLNPASCRNHWIGHPPFRAAVAHGRSRTTETGSRFR